MTHQLTIEPIGDAIDVAEGQTILDACLRAGIYLPHACGHGLCGTCKTVVLDGEIDHGEASPFALMDFERDEGFVLACTATLKSDVTVEADVEEDPDARRIAVRDFDGVVVGARVPHPRRQGRAARRSKAMGSTSRPGST